MVVRLADICFIFLEMDCNLGNITFQTCGPIPSIHKLIFAPSQCRSLLKNVKKMTAVQTRYAKLQETSKHCTCKGKIV